MLALLSSMSFESALIRSSMKKVRPCEIAGKVFCYGWLKGLDALLVNTGIGRVNAAHSATCIAENFPVSHVINFGAGGAYPGSGLKNGDVAIASNEISGDEGVVDSEGWSSLRKIGIPLVEADGKKYFNEFPLMVPSFFDNEKLKKKKRDYMTKTGNFVTVSACTGTQKRARELEKRFNALCENMEGSAIAHICAIYKLPMFEIRGISNIAGIRDKSKWDLKLASENCQKTVLEIISQLSTTETD